MLTSYNGWPASKDPAEIGIKSYAVPGTNRKLRCAEAVAPLLHQYLLLFQYFALSQIWHRPVMIAFELLKYLALKAQ